MARGLVGGRTHRAAVAREGCRAAARRRLEAAEVTVFGDNPPRWLRWANTSGARATTTVIAMLALFVSGYLFYRLNELVTCIADQQAADQRRTSIIAEATDAERRADAALVAGPMPGGPDGRELRRLDVEARRHTDTVRAANPPLPAAHC